MGKYYFFFVYFSSNAKNMLKKVCRLSLCLVENMLNPIIKI